MVAEALFKSNTYTFEEFNNIFLSCGICGQDLFKKRNSQNYNIISTQFLKCYHHVCYCCEALKLNTPEITCKICRSNELGYLECSVTWNDLLAERNGVHLYCFEHKNVPRPKKCTTCELFVCQECPVNYLHAEHGSCVYLKSYVAQSIGYVKHLKKMLSHTNEEIHSEIVTILRERSGIFGDTFARSGPNIGVALKFNNFGPQMKEVLKEIRAIGNKFASEDVLSSKNKIDLKLPSFSEEAKVNIQKLIEIIELELNVCYVRWTDDNGTHHYFKVLEGKKVDSNVDEWNSK